MDGQSNQDSFHIAYIVIMRSTKEIQDLIDMPSSTIFCLWSSKNLIDHFEHLQIFGADFLDLNLLNCLSFTFGKKICGSDRFNSLTLLSTLSSHFKRSEIGKMKAILAFLDAFCCAYLLGYLLGAVSTSKSPRRRNGKCSQLITNLQMFSRPGPLKIPFLLLNVFPFLSHRRFNANFVAILRSVGNFVVYFFAFFFPKFENSKVINANYGLWYLSKLLTPSFGQLYSDA